MIGAERHAGRSASVKRYLLTHDIKALHECRDSACRRPFGVRLRGSSSFYRLIFDICAAPLRMTQWADCCVDNTILVCQSNIATNRLYLTERYTLCVILSGAAQRCNGERETRQLPRSRTPKGRRQAESRLLCKALYRARPTHKPSATAARCNKFPPPQKQKLSPRAPASYKAKQIFALHRRVRLGKVLGE